MTMTKHRTKLGHGVGVEWVANRNSKIGLYNVYRFVYRKINSKFLQFYQPLN